MLDWMIFFLLYSKVFVDIIFFNFLLLIIKIDFDWSDSLYIFGVFVFLDEFFWYYRFWWYFILL